MSSSRKKIIKQISAVTIQPLLRLYLSKERSYTAANGIQLAIAQGVFHPAFFFSTKILLKYVNNLDLHDKSVLELGAGNGLIAMSCAKMGAKVVATDINKSATEYLIINSHRNNVALTVIHSDLFNNIPAQKFDCIFINPPYFKKNPSNDAEYAWYCGENGEYFTRLFGGLSKYVHQESTVLMILSDECDLDMIKEMAINCNFSLHLEQTTSNIIEQLFIYRIQAL